jgi:uncharacterized protein (DUF433 family)
MAYKGHAPKRGILKQKLLHMRRLKIEQLANLDPREVPLYWMSEVSRFTGIPESTLQRWTGQKSGCAPLICPPKDAFQQRKSELRLSFSNLLEAHILDAVRKRDIPINRIRRGLEYLRHQAPRSVHPLLSNKLYSAPGTRDMFVRTLEGSPVNISRFGQPALGQILDEHLQRIEWDRSGPVRLVPMRSDKVVIDLNVSGAQPVIRGTGVLASMLASRWHAGDSYEDLARGYALPIDDVREAIKYIDIAA